MSLHKDPDPFDRRTEVDLKVSVIRVDFHSKVNSSSGDWNTQEVQLIHPSLKGFLGSFSRKCLNATEELPRAQRWQEGPRSGLKSEGSPPLVQGPIMLSLEKYLFMIDDFKIELLLIFQFFCCCCLFLLNILESSTAPLTEYSFYPRRKGLKCKLVRTFSLVTILRAQQNLHPLRTEVAYVG